MFHVHAWGIPYAATQLGIKQVYPGRYEPEMLLKLIDKEKVTYSHCVPTILQMILDTPSAKKTDLTSWKVIVGGSRLTKGLAIDFIHKGIEIYAGCGMSEAGPLVASATLKPWMLKQTKEEQADTLIKSGMPGPFVYIRLFDPVTGKEVPHDGVSTGEVCLRSPWLTESYHNDPERSKELWRDGWLHSGDIGHIDKEGYLQFTDRIKDVIKTGGEWISSLDLENILSQHEAVKEAAAIGIPDAKWGERPFMVVVLKPEFEGKIKGEVFREFIMEQAKAGKIPKYAVPNRIEIIDAIPKTSVGKVSKVELRKSYC
jgi:fatty-acyl-CoA synthase